MPDSYEKSWRRRLDASQRVKVLQTLAYPFDYAAFIPEKKTQPAVGPEADSGVGGSSLLLRLSFSQISR